MPRIFSDADRQAIRERLLLAGREQFRQFGLRKTNVEGLARTAGIAKGTFYNFFQSKEDLCLEIFDREQHIIEEGIRSILQEHTEAFPAIRAVMAYNLEFLRTDSLIQRLRELDEISLLARGVRAEKLQEHLNADHDLTTMLIAGLRDRGAACDIGPEVLAGILRALVMASMHEQEIGVDVFDSAMQKIFDWVGAGLVSAGAAP